MTRKPPNSIDTQKVLEAAKAAANRALLRLGLKVERAAKRSMKGGVRKEDHSYYLGVNMKTGKGLKGTKVKNIVVKHDASAPGTPPNVQSGNLRASITTAMDKNSVVVGAVAKYGKVHETGGTFTIPAHTRKCHMLFGVPVPEYTQYVKSYRRKWPKRPFIRPALAKVKADLRQEFEGALKK